MQTQPAEAHDVSRPAQNALCAGSRLVPMSGVFCINRKTPLLILKERRNPNLAITKQKKEELLERYKEQIENAPAIVFTDYRGTSVSKMQALRAKLSETGTTYMVVKNSLLALALEQTGRNYTDELLAGPKAVAFVGEDIGKGVTALKDWIKTERIIEITGALLESTVLDAAGADSLSDLPTKEQTLAEILGVLNAPAGNIARILNAPSSSLARVINAYVEKQQAEEAA
jgi:large subunit ribosomal protein L10